MTGSLFVDHIGGGARDPSAAFQFDSVTGGFLPPRMTTTERDAISSPAEGLLIHNTTTDALNVYVNGAWTPLAASGSPAFTGNVSITGDANTTPVFTITNNDSSGAPGNPFLVRSSRNGAALQTNDRLGGMIVAGYGTSGFGGTAGNFTFHAAENFTDSAQGTYFLLGLTAIGGTGTNEIFRVLGAGNFLLGTTVASPLNFLALGGNTARSMGMERHTTSNTAGNDLTVLAGGATSAATNKIGGSIILSPGIHTGNALPGVLNVKGYAKAAGSGTGDATQLDRVFGFQQKVLTNNSATTILNATLASLLGMGLIIRYMIEVTNGTDSQVEIGEVRVSGVNKAGVFTMTINELSSQQSLSSAATLATTWAVSSANPAAVSINANSSLTPSTGYPLITYWVENYSRQALAVA